MRTLCRKLPVGCALVFVCLCLAVRTRAQLSPAAPNRVLQTPDNSSRITLKGKVHPVARSEFSNGPVSDALPINRILLLLKRSEAQEAALQSLLEAQQDKSSPNYWLTPEDFGKQFGPSDSDLQSVTSWLSSQGFYDIHVGPGRNVIEFSGTAGQVHTAFATQIYDNGTGVLGPFSLSNGQAQTTAQFGNFGVGFHQLTAVYNGDSENETSTSAPVSQAITGAYSIQIQGWTGGDGHFLFRNRWSAIVVAH